ncbi:hypothetical protein Tco_0236040, partial [Tanacetum coccineum]
GGGCNPHAPLGGAATKTLRALLVIEEAMVRRVVAGRVVRWPRRRGDEDGGEVAAKVGQRRRWW